jgi:hypothetical protein
MRDPQVMVPLRVEVNNNTNSCMIIRIKPDD